MDDSIHFFDCTICGKPVDMRDLVQVFEHEHADLPTPTFSISKQVGDNVEWKDGMEPIHLN